MSHCPPIGSNTFAEDVLDRLRGGYPEAGRQAEAGPAAARQGHLREEQVAPEALPAIQGGNLDALCSCGEV